jgi:hypothetical protein
MKVPKPLLMMVHTIAFPAVITVAWFTGHASLGSVIISAQVSVIGIQLQKYFWTEADYYEVRRFLFRDGK